MKIMNKSGTEEARKRETFSWGREWNERLNRGKKVMRNLNGFLLLLTLQSNSKSCQIYIKKKFIMYMKRKKYKQKT